MVRDTTLQILMVVAGRVVVVLVDQVELVLIQQQANKPIRRRIIALRIRMLLHVERYRIKKNFAQIIQSVLSARIWGFLPILRL
ncbi:protein of unknown function [Georgfuchsia toluolica]|uniref:Uncharacterized protein n=1 Tax=Georgfuchsia toluolica TaxID=424218 RepID=A0A916J3Y6_9PROT|nr:protein of unknown function [Georgfuchsia toluolica]